MISARPATEGDRGFFERCLAKDEVHKALGLSWRDATEEGTSLYLLSDEHGPLMFVRLHEALRAAMQFDPGAGYRTAKAAPAVIAWLREAAKGMGFDKRTDAKEVIIRPGGRAVRFAERLGFAEFIGKSIGV